MLTNYPHYHFLRPEIFVTRANYAGMEWQMICNNGLLQKAASGISCVGIGNGYPVHFH